MIRMDAFALLGLLFLYAGGGLAAADGESQYAAFLGALENLDQKKFSEVLLDEMHTYVRAFPDAANRDEVHFKLAALYQDKGREEEALYAYLQMLYFYPRSERLATVRDRIRSLLYSEGKFEPLRQKVDTVLNPTVGDTTEAGRYHALLRDLVEYDVKPLYRPLIAGCEEFVRRFPQATRRDEVRYWHAEVLAKDEQYARALAEYMKLTYLFDQSLYVSASKLKMAELMAEKLDMAQNAVFTLEEFLLEYPKDPQAPAAQLYMARILEKKRKAYLEAINAYAAVAQKYPKSAEAVPALFEAARLYEEKYREYDQAIRVYTEIVRDFPEDLKAPYAMAEAARIYEKRLKDYPNAANVYFKLYGTYPQSSIAPEALYAAAELNEKKLNDRERALTYYRTLVDQYPGHELAKKAARRIEKLSEEAAK